jgi:hypothetical protein
MLFHSVKVYVTLSKVHMTFLRRLQHLGRGT